MAPPTERRLQGPAILLMASCYAAQRPAHATKLTLRGFVKEQAGTRTRSPAIAGPPMPTPGTARRKAGQQAPDLWRLASEHVFNPSSKQCAEMMSCSTVRPAATLPNI